MRLGRRLIVLAAGVPTAMLLIACTPHQPRCISTDELVLDHVFEQVPGGVAAEGSGTPGPDSDGFFYVAIRFDVARTEQVGVWGYSAENDVYAVDDVAVENSGWPALSSETGVLETFAERAVSCLEAQG